jgi:uncharacterized surface protein with fasciclin (FAS1) repeats
MRHTRITVAAAAALAALTLAACGSSTTGSSTPAASSPAASTPAASTPAAAGTIVDVAAANPDFTTLVAAVMAAGLADFAPTNEAFAALPAGLVDKLLLPANKDVLAKILTYHVLASKVMAADVTDGKVATVEGGTITLDTMNGVKVNDATVVAADVAASNGVIHVIDKVLVPADVDVSKL